MRKFISKEIEILAWAGVDAGGAWLVSWILHVDFWQMLIITILLTSNRALYRATP